MFAPTAPYIIHLLKVHCQSVSLGKLCKRNAWIVSPSLYSKVRVIFAVRLYILSLGEIAFTLTAPYMVNLFKVRCHL